MTEIRTIRPGEAEDFLELLCNVFELDYARAHAIFFSEPLFDLDRKWALFDKGEMISILTTVPLEFGWGRAIGVAGVATAADRQGAGCASQLLEEVIHRSQERGEGSVMLFAKDERLYRRVGFSKIDEILRGRIKAQVETEIPIGLEYEEVRTIYNLWAGQDPNRLRRDDLRWKYWRWNLRVCTPFRDGYICFEGGVLREALVQRPTAKWVLPADTDWLGQRSMLDHLGFRVKSPTVELHLMGYKVPSIPQMFMTDQF